MEIIRAMFLPPKPSLWLPLLLITMAKEEGNILEGLRDFLLISVIIGLVSLLSSSRSRFF